MIKNLKSTYMKFLDIQKRKEQVRKKYIFMEKKEWVCWMFKSDLVLE